MVPRNINTGCLLPRTYHCCCVLSSVLVYARFPRLCVTVDVGLAWFKLTFGTFFVVAGLGILARFYYVRNVFEIKARYGVTLLCSTSLLLPVVLLLPLLYVRGVRWTPFRTAVPFRGQTTRNLSGLSPKRDCGSL